MKFLMMIIIKKNAIVLIKRYLTKETNHMKKEGNIRNHPEIEVIHVQKSIVVTFFEICYKSIFLTLL